MFTRSGNGNYAYTSARAKAKKSRLLKQEDYDKMVMMSVPEISHYISEAGYSKEMAELGNRHEGISLVEYATYANLGVAFRSILKASTGELRNMVDAYLLEWDFMNLKTILRGKHYGLPIEEIHEDLVVAARLNASDLDDMLAAPGIEETIEVFESKMSIKITEGAIASYRDTNMLKDLEDEFEKMYFKNLLDSISGKSRAHGIFRTYVRKVVDARNLETLLKLKVEGINGEVALDYFIPGGLEIDRKVYTQIAAAPDLVSAGNEMQSTKIGAEVKDAINEDATLISVVSAIRKYEAELSKSVAHTYPLSVIPVADFMIHKKNEVANIRMIAHGVDSGLDVATMKELLVI